MDEKNTEEKEYNDIESLAAYLHSGKMQAFKAAEQREEMGLPPEPEDERTDGKIEDVLFSIESKKQRPTGKKSITRSEYDKTVRGSSGKKEPDAKSSGHPQKSPAAVKTRPDKPENASVAENAKKKIDSVISDAKSKLTEHKKEVKKPEPEVHESSSGEAVPALAASLSAALGEKAAEISEQNRNSLPPEDTPEVFDVTEGTEEAKSFDNAATRLMNAVNDPQERSISMMDDVEAEEEELREERMQAARLRLNYERQKQSTRTLAYILIALLLCAAILGAAAYASTYLVKWALDFTGVGAQEFRLDVTIPDDADIETVAAILSENNIISDAKFFKMYADFTDSLKKIEDRKDFIGGKYTVSSTMSYSTLLSILRTKTEEIKTVNVRIVEGMTAHDIGKLLEENNVCFADDFEKYYKNIQNIYDFERRVKENSLKFCQLEGYLFPDTYEFYIVNSMENGGKPGKNETAEEAYEKMKKESEENAKEAAKKMYSNFNEKMTRSMYKRMGEMNMTLDEVIALASIVQREAAYAEDMGNVASVFLNRIRNSAEFPYLQSDVTVLYVENDIKPYITGSDASKQRIYNAYNTYVCQGIPAGAVCNPGLDAINAVLYAPETPNYYFCANEETGEIYYAVTQEEHEQNLILAQLRTDGSTEEGSGMESENIE